MRYAKLFSLGLLVSLAFLIVSAYATSSAGALSQTPAANDCPVSPRVAAYPAEGPEVSGDYYANADRTMWATLGGWDFVLRGGGHKVLWVKPSEYPIIVTGQRIDGAAPPLVYDTPDPHRRDSIQPSSLEFPTAGCWEVDAKAGSSELRFVVQVKSTTPVAEYRASITQLTKLIAYIANLTPRQLSDSVAGDVQFPGRDDWEQRLDAQKEKLVATTRTAINAVQQMLDAPTKKKIPLKSI
jgi:hypothetical protein